MFQDRQEAGKRLASKLLSLKDDSTLVVALPRGGVEVGFPIAKMLETSLEILVVRKIGAPYNPELGIGAVSEDDVTFLDKDMLALLQIPKDVIKPLQEKELKELNRRRQLYRDGKPLPLMLNKTVILVDDGLATGVSAHAALLTLKKHHPKKIIFVVPVCSYKTAQIIHPLVGKIVCLNSQEELEAIGKFYKDFEQVSDKKVLSLLQKIRKGQHFSSTSESDFTHRIVW